MIPPAGEAFTATASYCAESLERWRVYVRTTVQVKYQLQTIKSATVIVCSLSLPSRCEAWKQQLLACSVILLLHIRGSQPRWFGELISLPGAPCWRCLGHFQLVRPRILCRDYLISCCLVWETPWRPPGRNRRALPRRGTSGFPYVTQKMDEWMDTGLLLMWTLSSLGGTRPTFFQWKNKLQRTWLYLSCNNPFTKPFSFCGMEITFSSIIQPQNHNNGYPHFKPIKAKHKCNCLTHNPSFTSFHPSDVQFRLFSLRDGIYSRKCLGVSLLCVRILVGLMVLFIVLWAGASAHCLGHSFCCC